LAKPVVFQIFITLEFGAHPATNSPPDVAVPNFEPAEIGLKRIRAIEKDFSV
jgi:hypothetical protein